jgi:hypothetical protein
MRDALLTVGAVVVVGYAVILTVQVLVLLAVYWIGGSAAVREVLTELRDRMRSKP